MSASNQAISIRYVNKYFGRSHYVCNKILCHRNMNSLEYAEKTALKMIFMLNLRAFYFSILNPHGNGKIRMNGKSNKWQMLDLQPHFFIHVYFIRIAKMVQNFLPSKLQYSCKWKCFIIQKIQNSIFNFTLRMWQKQWERTRMENKIKRKKSTWVVFIEC